MKVFKKIVIVIVVLLFITFVKIVPHKAKVLYFSWDSKVGYSVIYNSKVEKSLTEEEYKNHPKNDKTVKFNISILSYLGFKTMEVFDNNVKFRDIGKHVKSLEFLLGMNYENFLSL